MKATNETVEPGETVELGRIEHIEVQRSNSKLNIRAVWEDEGREWVVLAENVENGVADVNLHSRATVVGFVESSGIAADRLVYVIPLKYYGE